VAIINLTPDELLTTTRAVRKRLDLERPVEPALIEECLAIAEQAPTGSNRQDWQFVVVTDPAKRKALGDFYRRGWEKYRPSAPSAAGTSLPNPERAAVQARVVSSAAYLAEHMGDAPVLLVPCIAGRTDGKPAVEQAGRWGSILPATWSFMLAARARGLGTAWTTLHLYFEKEAADLLGIPYAEYMQAGLIPVAYARGTHFRPGPRDPLERTVHWDAW
jgi:nitroreductase